MKQLKRAAETLDLCRELGTDGPDGGLGDASDAILDNLPVNGKLANRNREIVRRL